MRDFTTINPTRIEFGKGKEAYIGNYMSAYGAKKALIVYGSERIKNNGLFDVATKSLKESNIDYCEIGGVKSNPVISKAREAVEIAKSENVDCVLAIGGGSVLDTAKVVAAGALYEGDTWDLCNYSRRVEKSLRIFDIMTLAATGSEMNGAAVIQNEDTKQKLGLYSIYSYPTVSIINPELQATVSDKYLAYSASDVCAHCFDLYFTASYIPEFMLNVIENIVKTIMRTTDVLLKDKDNYEARSEFAWAATNALNGSTFPGSEGFRHDLHTFEHSLSALYDLPHGAGLAVVMPAWFEWSVNTNKERYERFAKNIFDLNSAEEGVAAFKTWLSRIGNPVSLSETSIPEADFDIIVDDIFKGLSMERVDAIYSRETVAEVVNKMK